MEYILVRLKRGRARQVVANENVIGKTGRTLLIEPGYYEIKLNGNPTQPASWNGDVVGTDPDHPLVIKFSPE